MYFDKLNLWTKMKNAKILHFAPEKNLKQRIKQINTNEYILADLMPKDIEIQKIDATAIPYKDCCFDFVICNHVLEHIPKYKKAINEIFRILKNNGIAILQTPYSKLLKKNFEDCNLVTDEIRLYFYGREDHVRIFSEENLFNDLKDVGFKLNIIRNNKLFSNIECKYFGVNPKEDLIMVIKPNR